MGFYPTTENPNVMMRANHKTKRHEYIVICQDDLYIASTIPEEILHTVQDKYKIIFIKKLISHMIQVEEIFVNSKDILKNYMKM